jgi:hypothetical protein
MIEQGICTAFKQGLFSGTENVSSSTSYTYQIALYTADANLGPEITGSITQGEVSGGGYTRKTLTLIPLAVTNNVAYFSFQNVIWNPASFTARAAVIYNSTNSTPIAVLDFGGNKTASNTFTIAFPPFTPTDAIIRTT